MIPVLLQWTGPEPLADRLRGMLGGIQQGAVDLSLAAVVALLGWGVATLAASGVRALLRRVRFNEGVRGLHGPQPAGRHEPAALVSWAVFWLLISVGFVFAADVLGFELSRGLAERMRDIVPRVLTASVLLVGGVLLAMGLGALTQRFFESASFGGGRLRGQVVTGLFTFFAVLLALEQLGFAAQFVMGVGLVLAAAGGLAIALAFGLGCRELARDFVVEYLRSLEEDRKPRP